MYEQIMEGGNNAGQEGFNPRAVESFTVSGPNSNSGGPALQGTQSILESTTRSDLDFGDTTGSIGLTQALEGIQVGAPIRQEDQTTASSNPYDEVPVGGTGQSFYRANTYDERPINATGEYDLSQLPLDDIEIQENYSEVEMATFDESLLDHVKERYAHILNEESPQLGKKLSLERDEEARAESEANRIQQDRQRQKDEIAAEIGEAKFQALYDCLWEHRSIDEGTDERQMFADIKGIVGGVKEHMNLAFKLDNIIFLELIQHRMGSQAQL